MAPLLSKREEYALIRKAQHGSYKAKQELLNRNKGLVFNTVRKHLNSITPAVDREDLLQEANLGLLHAIKKFNFRKGLRLSTYAVWWMMQYTKRALQKQSRLVSIPSNLDSRLLGLVKENEFEGNGLGKKLTPELVARKLKLKSFYAARVLSAYARPRYFSAPVSNYRHDMSGLHQKTLGDTIPSFEPLPDDDNDILTIIQDAKLDTETSNYIIDYFGLDNNPRLTYMEISAKYNSYTSRVSSKIHRGLSVLRTYLGNNGLDLTDFKF